MVSYFSIRNTKQGSCSCYSSTKRARVQIYREINNKRNIKKNKVNKKNKQNKVNKKNKQEHVKTTIARQSDSGVIKATVVGVI